MAVSFSATDAFSPSMAVSFSATDAFKPPMASSFWLTRPSSSVTLAFVSAASASSLATCSLAAVRSACSCWLAASPFSTWAVNASAWVFASASWALTSSYWALAASRSAWSAAELFRSSVNWACVEERDSLLAFSLLLKNSIAMMASTSSTSSTICHTLPLEFITRPPCVYIWFYYSMNGLHLTRSSRHFVELMYQSTIAPPRHTCP